MKRITVLSSCFFIAVMVFPGSAWSETQLSDKVTLSGVVEVEAGKGGGMGSEIALATVELGLDAKISEGVDGHLIFLYEEGEDFTVDEGTITLTAPYGLTVTAGKMYIPFGMFNSHFISDPLTLELGETNETAIMLGYTKDMIELSAGVFNGDVHEAGEDDDIDDYVISLTVTPVEGLSFGASYISDIADTDGDITGAVAAAGTLTDIVAGYSAFISASVGPVTLEAEYLAAAKKFDAADIATEDRPSTFNVEIAYPISEAAELALRYEGAEDFDIEKQYGIAYSRELYENTSFALEYIAGEKENGDDIKVAAVQLGIEF